MLALLIATLLVSEGAAIAVVLAIPPDRTIYRLDEIASALRGGPLKTRGGRPLVRTVEREPVARTGAGWITPAHFRFDLARTLDVSPEDVRLQAYAPPPLVGGLHRLHDGSWRRDAFDGGPPPRDGWRDATGRPEPPPPEFRERGPPPPLHVSFVASMRRPDGRWTTVTPAPEPFPNDWQRRIIVWFLATFAVIGPVGWLFARRLAAPLRRFAEAADRLGRDPAADPAMDLGGPAEIGQAATAFNRMRARLQRYVEDRTAMVGAISHDLRTPLSRMRFKLEGAPAELRRSVLTDVAQMEEMISAVLAFIRDAAEPGPRERMDLRSLVECEVDEAALVGGDVALEPGPPVVVEADAGGVQRVVANLIGNALKYGERARVSLRRDEAEAVVEIADEGPGLPAAEMERVFLPFYRAEAARTLDKGGIGLGLAVSRSIARAHGGDVRLSAGPDKGLVAELRLPLALQPQAVAGAQRIYGPPTER